MKKRHRWILYSLFLLLLLMPSVIAKQEVTQTSGGLLEIAIPAQSYYPLNKNFTIYAHVYNSSNAVMIEPNVNCYFHMYNNSGNHLINSKMEYEGGSEREYIYIVDTKLIDFPGIYSYIITCNNSENGYVSSFLRITRTGTEPTDDLMPLAIIVISPLLFGLICVLGVFVFKEDNWPIKVALFCMGFFSFILTLLLGLMVITNYYIFIEFGDTTTHIAYVMALFLMTIMFYLGITYLRGFYQAKEEEKIEKRIGAGQY